MSWTKSQRAEIVERAWTGKAVCPEDGAELEICLAVRMDGDYRLQASCPTCRRRAVMARRDDPRRHTFHAWTGEEITALTDAVLQGKVPACPVCGAGVATEEFGARGGSTLAMHCVRCGNVASRQLVRQK